MSRVGAEKDRAERRRRLEDYAPPQTRADVDTAERLALSERDTLAVLALLENPPVAPDRLVHAAKAGLTLP